MRQAVMNIMFAAIAACAVILFGPLMQKPQTCVHSTPLPVSEKIINISGTNHWHDDGLIDPRHWAYEECLKDRKKGPPAAIVCNDF